MTTITHMRYKRPGIICTKCIQPVANRYSRNGRRSHMQFDNRQRAVKPPAWRLPDRLNACFPPINHFPHSGSATGENPVRNALYAHISSRQKRPNPRCPSASALNKINFIRNSSKWKPKIEIITNLWKYAFFSRLYGHGAFAWQGLPGLLLHFAASQKTEQTAGGGIKLCYVSDTRCHINAKKLRYQSPPGLPQPPERRRGLGRGGAFKNKKPCEPPYPHSHNPLSPALSPFQGAREEYKKGFFLKFTSDDEQSGPDLIVYRRPRVNIHHLGKTKRGTSEKVPRRV